MEKLGVMDQMFYKADQYRVATMCMGGAMILAPTGSAESLDGDALAEHLAARLERIPLLRMKLVQDPLRIGSVCKVEDPEFRIWDHIDVQSVPAPGDQRELTEAIALLSATPLDSGQLWRWTILEGLPAGRLALFIQLHHALADGIAAVRVLSSMYDVKPVRLEKPSKRHRENIEEPSSYALLGSALAQNARRLLLQTPRFLLRNTLPVVTALGAGVRQQLARGEWPEFPELHDTSLNVSGITGRRALSYKTLRLAEIKRIARHFGCTVNDVGLLLYSFALQNYFDAIWEDIDFDLVCGVPISTRSDDSETGNQVAVGRVCLHNTIDDAVDRLRAISRDATDSKRAARPEKPLLDMEEVGELFVPLLFDALFYLAGRFNLFGRLGGSTPVMHALLSNVPGPPTTLYIGQAKLVESIPLIPLVDVIAVSGGITSTAGNITIGFHCDGGVVQEPELFVQGVEKGLRALRAAMKKKQKQKSARTARKRGRRAVAA